MAAKLDPSAHKLSLLEGEIVEESDLGSMRRVTADNLPILRGLSIKHLVINPGAMRTPHWHANANELTYCISGTSLVSVLDSGSQFSSCIVGPGEMFHVDSGSLHHIENIGGDPAEFVLAFRHERPEDFGLGAAFGAMANAVLGNTYDLPASDFATIRRDTSDRRLSGIRPPRHIPSPRCRDASAKGKFGRSSMWTLRYSTRRTCISRSSSPVLSIYQTDIICYGFTLVDYFTNEFGQPYERHNRRWARAFGLQPIVDFWSDLVS